MTRVPLTRMRWLLLAAAATGWPWVFTSPADHRTGVQAVALALVGLSAVPTLGWLRTPAILHPAASTAGAVTAAVLLARGQVLPLAIVAAGAAGAALGLLALAPVLRTPRRGLPATALLSALLVAGVATRLPAPAFARPTVLGVELAGDRALYLTVLLLVGAVLAVLHGLRRSGAAVRLAAVGAGGDLAARSGVGTTTPWLEAAALSGAVAGIAGVVTAVLNQGSPAAGTLTPGAVVVGLAPALLGGAAWPSGVVVAAAALAVLQRLVSGGLSAPAASLAAVAAAAPLLLPGGFAVALRRMAGRRA